MIKALAPATLIALGLAATPVLAQSHADAMDPTRPVATDTGTGSMNDISQRSWSESIRDVFFTDETMQSLRHTDEMAERWALLDPEEKEVAKRDCQAFLMDAGSMGGASTGGLGGALTPDESQGTTDPAATASDELPSVTDSTTARSAPPSPGNSQVWNQACSFVTSFQSQ